MATWSISESRELNDVGRWDAEAFSPLLRSIDEKLTTAPYLFTLATVSHPTEITRAYERKEMSKPFLLAQNIRPFLPDMSNEFRIPLNVAHKIPSNRLEHGDVLVTRTGANSGMCAVYLGNSGDCYTSGEGLILRSKGDLHGAYLATFLNTAAGQALCRRAIYGSGQPHIGPRYLERSRIPRLGSIEKESVKLVQDAYDALHAAEKQYPGAEAELLASLGWEELDREAVKLTYVQQFSELSAAGRADAECFQPRVRQILASLSSQNRQIAQVAPLRQEPFTAKRGNSFHYIEISDVSPTTLVTGTKLAGEDAPDRAKQYVREGDVITSTVRAVRRLSGLIEAHQEGWVCSSGFAVLHPVEVPAEYLVAYLRLPPVCELMDAFTTATMYPAISVHDLLNIPIFVPDSGVVERVCGSVRQVRRARLKADSALEAAKKLVEEALMERFQLESSGT
jgi:hypothetical protein